VIAGFPITKVEIAQYRASWGFDPGHPGSLGRDGSTRLRMRWRKARVVKSVPWFAISAQALPDYK